MCFHYLAGSGSQRLAAGGGRTVVSSGMVGDGEGAGSLGATAAAVLTKVSMAERSVKLGVSTVEGNLAPVMGEVMCVSSQFWMADRS